MIHIPAVVLPACGIVPFGHGLIADLTLLGKEAVGLLIIGMIGWGLWKGVRAGHAGPAIVGALVVGSLATWVVASGTLWGANQVAGTTHSSQVSALIAPAPAPTATPAVDPGNGAC